MRKTGPWDAENLMAGREPPTVEQIRKLALTSLRMRFWPLALSTAATVLACWVAITFKVSFAMALGLMIMVLMQAIPYARTYLPTFRQWRDLGDSHRDLGLTRLHYSTIVMETALLLLPAIGAAILLAHACASFE